MAPLGFASGLPLLLTGSTLTAWMTVEGVDLTTIGLMSLVGLPYSFKFLWAPLMDRFNLPLLGRRRGWMVLSQLLLLVSIGVMGFVDPKAAPGALALMALLVAFCSASQDIVSDAYRTDVLPAHERASGTAVFVAGYRVALIVAGAGALLLSDHMHWWAIYCLMGGLMLIGTVATWFAPSPTEQPRPPESLSKAVYEPVVEFFKRPEALSFLFVVMFYKIGDALAGHMITPFLLKTGFEMVQIATLAKGLGLAATVAGALVGGGLVARFGLKASLLVFGVLQASANFFYLAIDVTGTNALLLAGAIGVDNFFGGLATAAFVAYLMSLCNKRFTAVQYAAFSSASSVIGRVLGGGSGWFAESLGWSSFFVLTVVLAVPGLLVLSRLTLDDQPETDPS